MSRGRTWVPEEIEKLLTLYREGKDIEEIGKELNRSPGGVAGRLFKEKEISKTSEGRGYKLREKPKKIPTDLLKSLEEKIDRIEALLKECMNA